MAELNRRILDLEQRVQILESKDGSESEPAEGEKQGRRRKMRRRNHEMRRDRAVIFNWFSVPIAGKTTEPILLWSTT